MEGFKKDRKFSVLGLAVLWGRTQGLILGKCSGTEPQPQTNKSMCVVWRVNTSSVSESLRRLPGQAARSFLTYEPGTAEPTHQGCCGVDISVLAVRTGLTVSPQRTLATSVQ